MDEYIIRETNDFLALSTLFHESGMGVAIEERVPDRVIKMWRMDDPQTGELMAASTFEMRDGVYTLGDIAVRSDLHRKSSVFYTKFQCIICWACDCPSIARISVNFKMSDLFCVPLEKFVVVADVQHVHAGHFVAGPPHAPGC